MTEAVKIALIVAIGPTLMGMASLWASIKNRSKLDTLHTDLNSRLTEMIVLAKATAYAAGLLEGRNAERQEALEKAAALEQLEQK